MFDDRAWLRLKTWTLCCLVSLIEGYDLQSAGLATPRFAAPLLGIHAALGLSLAALASSSNVVLWPAACGFFTGAQFALSGLSAARYPSALRGTGAGTAVAIGRLGAIVGPLFAGVLFGAGSKMRDLLHPLFSPKGIGAGMTVLLIYLFRNATPDMLSALRASDAKSLRRKEIRVAR